MDEAVIVTLGLTVFVVWIFWASIRSIRAKKQSRTSYVGTNSERFLGKVSSARGIDRIAAGQVESGQGQLRVSDEGVFVDASNSFGGGNGGKWQETRMFVRAGNTVHLEWDLDGGRDVAEADFKASKQGSAERIEAIARRNLSSQGWKNDMTYEPVGRTDAFWSRD